MNNIWQELEKPFFVLAPMDDVTDSVFRRIVAECYAPDLFYTEFVSVDGLSSPGREALWKKLEFADELEKPLIAQVWGLKPDNYYKVSKELSEMGFAGIDINMGCPVPVVIKNGACSALATNRELADEIIKATKEGASGLPVSVKCRLGFNEIDLSWHERLLGHDLDALIVHGRTTKELSKVPNHWDSIAEVVKIRDEISRSTVVVGNGDVLSKEQGLRIAGDTGVDGIMIGRGIFQDPYVFSGKTIWHEKDSKEKIDLYRKHIDMFRDFWGDKKNPASLKKFAKVYVNGFEGAAELRAKLMECNDAQGLDRVLSESIKV